MVDIMLGEQTVMVVANPEPERWLPIEFADGYEVSNRGRVRSKRGSRDGAWRVLSTAANTKGFSQVCLRNGRGKGGAQNFYVHHLVLLAFLGPRPEGHIAKHKNRNRQDNRLENLYWAPHDEQYQRGEDHHNAKLTAEKVMELRRRFYANEDASVLAEEFDISEPYVYTLAEGDKVWTHLPKIDGERTRTPEHIRGEQHSRSILSEDNVREMMRLWDGGKGGFTLAQLGERFDTHPSNVSRIVNGQHWRHLTQPQPDRELAAI